jgi:hypothetical protein
VHSPGRTSRSRTDRSSESTLFHANVKRDASLKSSTGMLATFTSIHRIVRLETARIGLCRDRHPLAYSNLCSGRCAFILSTRDLERQRHGDRDKSSRLNISLGHMKRGQHFVCDYVDQILEGAAEASIVLDPQTPQLFSVSLLPREGCRPFRSLRSYPFYCDGYHR